MHPAVNSSLDCDGNSDRHDAWDSELRVTGTVAVRKLSRAGVSPGEGGLGQAQRGTDKGRARAHTAPAIVTGIPGRRLSSWTPGPAPATIRDGGHPSSGRPGVPGRFEVICHGPRA